MKKIVLLAFAISFFIPSFSSSMITPTPKLRADQILIPIGKDGKVVSLLEISQMNMKELRELSGRKAGFGKSIALRFAQNKLRNSINPDGTIDNKKLQKWMKKANTKAKGGETGFHFGGFALGFFLGLIGVLIAYLINDDYKSNRAKWSWIGLGIAVLLNIVLILTLL